MEAAVHLTFVVKEDCAHGLCLPTSTNKIKKCRAAALEVDIECKRVKKWKAS